MAADVDSPDRLMDIIPPALPAAAPQSDAWISAVALAGLLAILWYAWRWYRSERQQSLRDLRGLRKAYKAREVAPRDACYWLAAFLRRRLRVNRLSADCPVALQLAPHKNRWQTFLDRLHSARYAPLSPSDGEIALLFTEARYWLRKWP